MICRFIDEMMSRRIVLASGSPRRRQLLADLGVDFTVETIDGVDETVDASLAADDVPLAISRKKSQAYCDARHPDDNTIVITADTVVVVDDEVLGKPAGAADARRMLGLLSGRTHRVVTGVTVVRGDHRDTRRQVTEVSFKSLSDDEIEYYISTYRPFDKAGAYGIQEWIGCVGIEGISGDYYNVMGLPLRLLYEMLLDSVSGQR
ncbi:MAG: Maf family nucleotide pyrophosphatase [Paramuribaculum sp.]